MPLKIFVYTLGSNADGFAVKLSAGPEEVTSASEFQNSKNTFVNCYSWENSDDGWDSFDYPSSKQNFNPNRWTYKNVYENCICADELVTECFPVIQTM